MKTRLALALILWMCDLTASAQQEVDAVAEGRKVFESYGCTVCHATARGDQSALTGPNLYGLFLNQPREREVADPRTGERRKVKADKNYYTTSVRKSWDALAVAESGQTKGEPYPQIMAKYSEDVIPNQAVEYAWHYLRTLAVRPVVGFAYGDQVTFGEPIATVEDDWALSYQIRAGLGFPFQLNERMPAGAIELSYSYEGGVTLGGEKFNYHEALLSIIPNSNSPASVNFSYLRGNDGFGQPDIDRFKAGIGIQF